VSFGCPEGMGVLASDRRHSVLGAVAAVIPESATEE